MPGLFRDIFWNLTTDFRKLVFTFSKTNQIFGNCSLLRENPVCKLFFQFNNKDAAPSRR